LEVASQNFMKKDEGPTWRQASEPADDQVRDKEVDLAIALAGKYPSLAPNIMGRLREQEFIRAAPLALGAIEALIGPEPAIAGLTVGERAAPTRATIPYYSPSDAAQIGRALDAAGGQRIFYGGTVGDNMVAARFNGNVITFDSQTHGEAVATVLEELERTNPGSQVSVGSGTHGAPNGDLATRDLNLREFRFFGEDRATVGHGNLPGLGPRTVFDLGTTSGPGSNCYLASEQSALASSPGSAAAIRAWCFSTLARF
jgi:hypothetical protein